MKNYTLEEISKGMFESLIKYPCGSVMNLEDLAADAGFVNLDIQEWIEIRQHLEKLLKADGRYKIDFSKGNGFVLGLPQVYDFVFLKKRQSVHNNETKVAKAFADKENVYGIKYIMFWCGICYFQIINAPGILVDPAFPPKYIVVDENMKARWSSEEESVEMYNMTGLV